MLKASILGYSGKRCSADTALRIATCLSEASLLRFRRIRWTSPNTLHTSVNTHHRTWPKHIPVHRELLVPDSLFPSPHSGIRVKQSDEALNIFYTILLISSSVNPCTLKKLIVISSPNLTVFGMNLFFSCYSFSILRRPKVAGPVCQVSGPIHSFQRSGKIAVRLDRTFNSRYSDLSRSLESQLRKISRFWK